ncbi:hypothetical protein CQA53_01285 [Helicobacter didelphidarum]|uniref:Uncharacterized protein n=1 Tax=Helicobacter didelphidarum TaxID=2040648 RepID=A0A3D8IRD6_9HELI|nr:hypothetical protein CQA53_01285 [Helicobacter didelphidarum]
MQELFIKCNESTGFRHYEYYKENEKVHRQFESFTNEVKYFLVLEYIMKKNLYIYIIFYHFFLYLYIFSVIILKLKESLKMPQKAWKLPYTL